MLLIKYPLLVKVDSSGIVSRVVGLFHRCGFKGVYELLLVCEHYFVFIGMKGTIAYVYPVSLMMPPLTLASDPNGLRMSDPKRLHELFGSTPLQGFSNIGSTCLPSNKITLQSW